MPQQDASPWLQLEQQWHLVRHGSLRETRDELQQELQHFRTPACWTHHPSLREEALSLPRWSRPSTVGWPLPPLMPAQQLVRVACLRQPRRLMADELVAIWQHSPASTGRVAAPCRWPLTSFFLRGGRRGEPKKRP